MYIERKGIPRTESYGVCNDLGSADKKESANETEKE